MTQRRRVGPATLERRGATISAEIAALNPPSQAAWSSEAPAAATPVAAVTPTRPSCTDPIGPGPARSRTRPSPFQCRDEFTKSSGVVQQGAKALGLCWVLSAGHLPTPTPRIHQQGPASHHRRAARPATRRPLHRPDDLRLRRLRLHGLTERIPHTHRYQVTDTGLHTAMFLTRVNDRLLPTGLAHLNDPSNDGTLRSASTAYQHAIDALAAENGLAA